MKAVIDSDVLIDYLQGNIEAKTELSRYSEACFSVISWMEVMAGSQTADEEIAARTLLASMSMIALSNEIAEIAVRIRRSLRVKLPDAIILATADQAGCVLVTRNTKDFSEDDPRIRIPYAV